MRSVTSLLATALWAGACVSSATQFNASLGSILERRAIAGGVELRIMPLGDSITWGQGSTGSEEMNGYRNILLSMLSGNSVNYIGSVKSGVMKDNDNEGHSGAIITEIAVYAKDTLRSRPNVVLVMAGTNDILHNNYPADTPDRLGDLIDLIVAACPDAAVIVAKPTPFSDTGLEALTKKFRAAIPAIVQTRVNAGKRVLTVDMGTLTTNDLADGIHPNNAGYSKMATIFFDGIAAAAGKGWINSPVKTAQNDIKTCVSGALYWDSTYGEIATGVGWGDAAYSNYNWQAIGWQASGYVGTGGSGNPGSGQSIGVRLADLNGDGLDDYIWVQPNTGACILYLNGGIINGQVKWIYKGEIATGIGSSPTQHYGVRFADINGDGLDDYLWIDEKTGDVTAYKNGGEKSDGSWAWSSLGVICRGTGGNRDTIQFADIDGDGRVEYLIVDPSTGALNAWLNGGYGDVPDWQHLGQIATGTYLADGAGIHLQDINGDGRADYIHLDGNGKATAWINTRGPSRNLAPNWLEVGVIATGVGQTRDHIMFADLNGDRKADYIYNQELSGALQVWLNTGSGNAYVKGDGVFFADMDGDGVEDYVWISPEGTLYLWLNYGWNSASKSWNWAKYGDSGIISGAFGDRRNIRLADLDGDGFADVLIVDPTSGATTFWRNSGKAGNGWSFTNNGQIATGLGNGAGVRFADIDGDGKADYLWLDAGGAVLAYLNGGSEPGNWKWLRVGIIATGVGAPRQDIQFADIDGDGKADYLWVNRIDGSVRHWKNGGAENSASNWKWTSMGVIATGVGGNGYAIQFAHLTKTGRDDYLYVSPTTAAVTYWWNGCTEGVSDEPIIPIWQSSKCIDVGFVNADIEPTTRWNAVGGTPAWAAAVADFKADSSTPLTFSQHVSDYFNGPDLMDCGTMTDQNGCSVGVPCKDEDPRTPPAGVFILASMEQVYGLNWVFYESVLQALGEMNAQIGTFSSTFAEIVDTTAKQKVLLDLLGLGYALGVTYGWNIGLKTMTYWKDKSNDLSTIKDAINPLVSNGITLIKDGAISSKAVNAANKLQYSMYEMIKVWLEGIVRVNNAIFDGSDAGVSQLEGLIGGGKMLSPGKKPDALEYVKAIETALYGYLIPQAWRLSNTEHAPFIINTDLPCSAAEDYKFSEYLAPSDARGSQVCYEDKLYYLASAKGNAKDCLNVNCLHNKFVALPGFGSIDGSTWGTVTAQDLIAGSLASYAANGNKNGWGVADVSKQDTLTDLLNYNIRAPGVVMIPICTAQQAWVAWANQSKDSASYPCGST